MERWRDTVAVVTGASCGIGAAIASSLVEEGLHVQFQSVVGLARRKERMDELASKLKTEKGRLYALKADVTKESDVLDVFEWIRKELSPVHVLVNCAGIVRDTNLLEGTAEDFKAVLETNVLGLTIVTREAVKNMRENNVNGHVIHINSLAGHYVPNLRNFNVYPASKHAVTALAEVLRNDLNEIGSKIKISSVSPGATRSEICETNVLNGPFKADFKKGPRLSCEDVAEAVCYVLSTPPHVQIQELTLRAMGKEI